MYGAHINASQAAALKTGEYAFIDTVHLPPTGDEEDEIIEEHRVVNSKPNAQLAARHLPSTTHPGGSLVGQVTNKSRLDSRALIGDGAAPWWKNMLSAPPRTITEQVGAPRDDPFYIRDDSGGRGTTIYVLDDGFDIDIPVGLWLRREIKYAKRGRI
jgi:hypothetical protein